MSSFNLQHINILDKPNKLFMVIYLNVEMRKINQQIKEKDT